MMVRPKDILKIEYYDIPNGKYSKGRTSINFIVKRYNYGGYAMMKLQQYVGYNHGVYDIASNVEDAHIHILCRNASSNFNLFICKIVSFLLSLFNLKYYV